MLLESRNGKSGYAPYWLRKEPKYANAGRNAAPLPGRSPKKITIPLQAKKYI